MTQPRFDVVVMGGGLAGMTSALRACELGLKVLLAEQGSAPDYPCNSRYSGGIFHVAYHDMKTPADTLAAAVRAANPQAHDGQVTAIAANAGRAMDWLMAHGMKFMRASAIDWHRWCLAPPRLMRPGLVAPGRGRALDAGLPRLQEQVRSKGGTVLLGHTVTGLTRTGEGFEVSLAGGTTPQAKARCVVIADGGFQGNLDMLKTHISPRPDLIIQRGAGTSRGQGLQLAAALGAKLTAMDRFYGHLLHRDARNNGDLWPYPQIDTVASAGIVVGADGKRVCDEARGGVPISNMVAALADPTSAVAIFDQAIWDSAGRDSLYPVNPHVETSGGAVVRATTIEDLAQRLSLPADALAATVADMNAAVGAKDGSRLHPPRSGKLTPIGQAPYMAIPLAVGITHTMGGILVDGAARALDQTEMPIPGLYAAGTATGGLDGGDGIGYAGGLVKALIFGLLAAEHAAASA